MKDFRHILAASAISIVLAVTGCNQYVDPAGVTDTTTRYTTNTGARAYTNRGIAQRGVTRKNVRSTRNVRGRSYAPKTTVRRTMGNRGFTNEYPDESITPKRNVSYLNRYNSGRPIRTSNRYGTVGSKGTVGRTNSSIKRSPVNRTNVNTTTANKTAINRTGAIIGDNSVPRAYSLNNTGRAGALITDTTARAYSGVTRGKSAPLGTTVSRGSTINRAGITSGMDTAQITGTAQNLTANAATVTTPPAVTRAAATEAKKTAEPVKKSVPVKRSTAVKKSAAKKQAAANNQKTTATRAAKNVTAANKSAATNTANTVKKANTGNTINTVNNAQVRNNNQVSKQVNNTPVNTAGNVKQGQRAATAVTRGSQYLNNSSTRATNKVFVGGSSSNNIAPTNNVVRSTNNAIGNVNTTGVNTGFTQNTALRSGTNSVYNAPYGAAGTGNTFRGTDSYSGRAYLSNNSGNWGNIPSDYNIPSGRSGYINRSVSINGLTNQRGSASNVATGSLANRLTAGNTQGTVRNYADNLTVRNSIRDTALRNYDYSYYYPNSFNGVSRSYYGAPSGTYTSNDGLMLSTYGAGPNGMVDFGNGVTVYGANVHRTR